jgi:hypothetical protein
MKRNVLASTTGIVVVGAVIGILAAFLQHMGNPPNMGICVACMERDIAGALGFHRAALVQYLRPEIMGLVLGAFLAALVMGEYRPRGGSSPLIRFFLGIFAMLGALVFLGCPWRALLRLAGGDGNAILGILGLATGIAAGVYFLRRGFTLGRSSPANRAAGWIFPALMAGLFLLLLFNVSFGEGAPIFSSLKGPGSQHANLWLSLGAGGLIGVIAQRHLLKGVIALVAAAFLANLLLGQFHAGFENQPIAHTAHLWNFLGMVLAGMAFALAGGCPGRQLFLSGEGDADAAIFALGMIAGAGIAHNFNMASSSAGPGVFGPLAVLTGIAFCLILGLTMREKI